MTPFRFCIKLFFRENRAPSAEELIPLFHDWIRKKALDEILIDVSDYSHVPTGPGTILVCHDSIYGTDGARGENGFQYQKRRPPTEPTAEAAIGAGLRALLTAAAKLQSAPELGGRYTFEPGRILFEANDRIVLENDEKGLAAFSGVVAAVLGKIQPAPRFARADADPRERLGLIAELPGSNDISALLKKLEI